MMTQFRTCLVALGACALTCVLAGEGTPEGKPGALSQVKTDVKEGGKEGEGRRQGATGTNDVARVELKSVPAVYGGMDFGTFATLTAGKEKYEFQVPKGLNMRFTGTKVVLSGTDGTGSSISIGYDAGDGFPSVEALEEDALRRFPSAGVIARFGTAVLGTNAPSYQLQIRTGAEPWSGKVIYVPVTGGRLTISAASAPKDGMLLFNALQQVVGSINKSSDGASASRVLNVFQ